MRLTQRARAQPTATPIITPAPDAESSEAVEKSLFDPASADYTGSVVEMTDTGFTLSPTVVERLGANASVGVMAEAGASSSWFSVMCTDDTRYIAIYADGNGQFQSGGRAPADMVQAWCQVYITGSNTDSGFTADTVASEPVKPTVTRALLTVSLGLIALSVWWPLWFLFFGALTPADELEATIGPGFERRRSRGGAVATSAQLAYPAAFG